MSARSASDIFMDLLQSGLTNEQIVLVVELITSVAISANDAGRSVPRALSNRRDFDRERKRNDPNAALYRSEDWISLRNEVLKRDGFSCAYCDDEDDVELTADHVVPLSRGGTNDRSNLVCACLPCNSSKRNLLLTEWPGRRTARIVRDFSWILDEGVCS